MRDRQTVGLDAAHPASAPGPGRSAAWPVAAACVLGAAGWGFYQALPVALGALAQDRGFSDQQVGWLGSAELSGMLLGGLFAAWALAGRRLRQLAAIGLCLVLASLLGVATQAQFLATGAARVVGGFGAGISYSTCVACLVLTPSPTRNFGILNAVMVVLGAIELMAFPLINTRFGLAGLCGVLALECALAAVLLPSLPQPVAHPPTGAPTPAAGQARVGVTGLGYLVGTALFHIAPAIYWTYCERLGAEQHIAPAFIGAALTVISLVAAGVCLQAWRISGRWGERRSLLLTGGLMALSLLSWAAPAGAAPGFVGRALLFFTSWGLAGVLQQSEARLFDANGRLASLVPVAQGVGLAVGPVMGASGLAAGWDLPAMVSVSAVFVLASLAVYAAPALSAPPSASATGRGQRR